MRYFFFVITFVFSSFFTMLEASAQSCRCDVTPCGPCERAVGHTFYTAPCNGGRSVKSCKRFTCEPVENAKVCLAQLNHSKTTSAASLAPSSKVKKARARAIGLTLTLKGQAKLVRRSGAVPFRRGTKLYEGDLIETGTKGKVMIRLLNSSEAINIRGPAAAKKGANMLTIVENSKVTLVKHKYSEQEKQTLLKLWYGKIRSKVKENYKAKDGKANYRIHAGAAVAGIRGTEFVTEFRKGRDKWETTIRTLSGKVELSGLNQHEKVEIDPGQKASFVVDKPIQKSGFTPAELEEMARRGMLTPVYKMKAKELKEIDWETSFLDERDRSVASEAKSLEDTASRVICNQPMGQFQQCAWTCKGNRPGQQSCRTDLPGVACVRKVCDANGEWSMPTEFMSNGQGICPAKGTFVGSCDP